MKQLIALGLIVSGITASAQQHDHSAGRKIIFPDIPGYKTLRCDLHQHTVFSDGSVWPDIRVKEALRDGLDIISLTEHLEYQPHKDDIPHPNRNRSWEIAVKEAKSHELVIVKGSEITRKMPMGHCNAVFITDANKLVLADSIAQFREAKNQGAFTFWNHPNWVNQKKDGIATLTEVHRALIKDGMLHGIEVVNEHTYSDEALQIALDNNLTIMGNSDIHSLVDWDFKIPEGGHRPVTLVFSTDKKEESVKDALFNRRTVVYFNDLLIGRTEWLEPLVKNSLVITSAKYPGKTDVLTVEIENLTNMDFIVQNRSGYTLHEHHDVLTILPGKKNIIKVKTKERLSSVKLEFEILSAVQAPGKHPVVSWEYRVTN
jgi:3',5'-nucleoside bisphosphate phosphatase